MCGRPLDSGAELAKAHLKVTAFVRYRTRPVKCFIFHLEKYKGNNDSETSFASIQTASPFSFKATPSQATHSPLLHSIALSRLFLSSMVIGLVVDSDCWKQFNCSAQNDVYEQQNKPSNNEHAHKRKVCQESGPHSTCSAARPL